ncbi:MAG: hypothetical protein ACE5HF_05930 [Gemmatimonadota bacterium]
MTRPAATHTSGSEADGREAAPRRVRRHWAPVLSNEGVAADTSWLELESPAIACESRPGQFLMLGFGCGNSSPPFLPRPFSVAWTGADGRIGFLVRGFGEGTRRLLRLREGDALLLLGPLGRPFRTETGGGWTCVAGGVGLAPFLFLASRTSDADVRILYGERTADRVFDAGLLESLTGRAADVWTEDGTAGRRGQVLAGLDPEESAPLLACGPEPMLRAVWDFARRHDRPLQVSVEAHMGCGIGTCQGCVVAGADGSWLKACTEGPVFDARDLGWAPSGD